MIRVVSVREGEARKEPVVGLGHQMLNCMWNPYALAVAGSRYYPFYKYRKRDRRSLMPPD